MERPKPGARSISLLASNVSTIWFTDGGVTPKYRSMSASTAGRRSPVDLREPRVLRAKPASIDSTAIFEFSRNTNTDLQ